MNARQRLDEYLQALQRRLQLAMVLRASAIAALLLFAVTVAAILWLAPLGFPKLGVLTSRLGLLASLSTVAILWSLKQHRLRNKASAEFERHLPLQNGRLATYLEQRQQASSLIDLLADDALSVARETPVQAVVKSRHLQIAGVVMGAALLALLYLLIEGHGQWGYGSRHLLLGAILPPEAKPIKQVRLSPGDITVRRNSDLQIRASAQGFKPRNVELFVRFDAVDKSETAAWQRTTMQATNNDRQNENRDQYARTLYALRTPLKYYVIADGIKSDEHTVNVVDVPRIEHMQLSYRYPEWTGLSPRTEDQERNIDAVADTRVTITVQASEPLQDPKLVIDNKSAAMTASATLAKKSESELTVTKAARYHIAARVAGEWTALTDDYDISLVNDAAPIIEIVKPGRDWRASSIEEVPVIVRASDDFRVKDVELRYAVNGGDWHRMNLSANAPHVEDKTQLSMETLGGKTPLVPGDLVTYYAVTRDRKQTAQTDLYMVQVQPFERRFTESQSGGGGGGGADDEQQQIAERQKDLLLATWNLQHAREQQKRTPQQIQDSGQMLSQMQAKLAQQTKTLADRTRARSNLNSDARVKHFVESLEQATVAMQPAAQHLSKLELPQALPGEQQALQMLLRAESAFREIQVARQQGTSGGNRSNATRDISELYELEMDLNKNQYETEQQLSQESSNQEVDAALEKLRELARRQEQLAQRQKTPEQTQVQSNTERWQQEQLRREAEQLRRRLQQLAQQREQRNGQSVSQRDGSRSDEVSAALKSMDSALQAMRNAENSKQTTQQEEQSAQAGRSLQQAAERMRRTTQESRNEGVVDKLAEQARRLADAQHRMEGELFKAAGDAKQREQSSNVLNRKLAEALVQSKENLLKDEQQLEENLRNAIMSQRQHAPQTAKRLSDIGEQLSNINVPARLSRSIVDIERGRADRIALGESIVSDALENAATDLRAASKVAAREREQQANTADPQALLAELAELRRALASAEQIQKTNHGNVQQSSAQQKSAQSPRVGNADLEQSSRDPNNNRDSGDRNENGDESARLANAIGRQLNATENRVAAGALTRADIQALRGIIPRIGHLSGDPMAGVAKAALAQSINHLELTTLAATQKIHKDKGAHAVGDTPKVGESSETIAEYYRRLGK